jgi:hypothetical protein
LLFWPDGAVGPKYMSNEPSAVVLSSSYDAWAASFVGFWTMERVALSYAVKDQKAAAGGFAGTCKRYDLPPSKWLPSLSLKTWT